MDILIEMNDEGRTRPSPQRGNKNGQSLVRRRIVEFILEMLM
jgi:hypothetical protein